MDNPVCQKLENKCALYLLPWNIIQNHRYKEIFLMTTYCCLIISKLCFSLIKRTRLVLESFSSANRQNIILENGDRLPVSSTLEELQIRTSKGKEFTQEQVIGLISYGTQCRRLKNLS